MFKVNLHGLFPWNIKKVLVITKTFQEILNESGRKPNKIWIDKSSDFYNRSMKLWLQDDIYCWWKIY